MNEPGVDGGVSLLLIMLWVNMSPQCEEVRSVVAVPLWPAFLKVRPELVLLALWQAPFSTLCTESSEEHRCCPSRLFL